MELPTAIVEKELKEFSKCHTANSLVEETDKSDKDGYDTAKKMQNKQMESARKATIAHLRCRTHDCTVARNVARVFLEATYYSTT